VTSESADNWGFTLDLRPHGNLGVRLDVSNKICKLYAEEKQQLDRKQKVTTTPPSGVLPITINNVLPEQFAPATQKEQVSSAQCLDPTTASRLDVSGLRYPICRLPLLGLSFSLYSTVTILHARSFSLVGVCVIPSASLPELVT
jgi:hypothetical protein